MMVPADADAPVSKCEAYDEFFEEWIKDPSAAKAKHSWHQPEFIGAASS